MQGLRKPTRWLSSYFRDDDVLFYFEFDENGWVLRQVELEGPSRVPIVAASLAEMPDARTDGNEAVLDYIARYGNVADKPLRKWDADFPYQELNAEEFEEVWRRARANLERR